MKTKTVTLKVFGTKAIDLKNLRYPVISRIITKSIEGRTVIILEIEEKYEYEEL